MGGHLLPSGGGTGVNPSLTCSWTHRLLRNVNASTRGFDIAPEPATRRMASAFNLRAETRSAFHVGVNMSARGFSDIFPLLPRQSAT